MFYIYLIGINSKKLLKNIITLIFLFFSLTVVGQKFGRTTVSNVYEVDSVNAGDLFSRINFVLANMYNSVNDVVQFSDLDSKKIVIKALGEVLVPNQNRYLAFENVRVKYASPWNIHYTLNVAVRDGRYRLEINYGVVKSEITQLGEVFCPFKAIVKPTDEDKEDAVINKKDEVNGIGYLLIGKKKKQALLDGIPNDMDKFSDYLIDYAILTFENIHQGVLVSKGVDDDW